MNTTQRERRGGGCQDGWIFLSPCPVQSAFFFPTFIEKKQQQKSRVLQDEYFSSLLIENIRAFLPTFRAEKEICRLFGTDIFFKLPVFIFFFY